ncbi:hypothetical protein GOP47_0018182 [Adiantum capillus-veneris]|uniref:Pentatricopeptide repeat-containing protein n=1 Tax=Adiantum capillus-veneris TaxID=13818 RepID=A0A9D4UGU2_ADICA|nr:hypothetical protein GOP47_0018182 [Adiantum capillus-veneris]
MHEHGLHTHAALGNYLIPMLVEVGLIHDAQVVFDKLPCRNEWSWNSLMYGYVKCGKPQHTLDLYHRMRIDSLIPPSAYTIVAALKACTHLMDLRGGIDLHSEASKWGFLAENSFISNALIDMYAKFGLLAKAQEVFDKLATPNVVSWTVLIAGYAEHGHGNKAIQCFNRMQCEGISPDPVALVSSLKACINVGAVKKLDCLHAAIGRQLLLDKNLVVGNTLIDVYIKCGLLAKAQQVFDKLPLRDTVSWTTLIAGHVDHGYGEKAVQLFDHMQFEGVASDTATLVSTLKACGSIRSRNKGRELHAEAEKQGFLARSHAVCNTLVDMYSKCGLVAKARQIFDTLAYRDVVSWTALISGYAECGHGEEALDCFEKMKADGVSPNATTFICGLKACSSIGAMEKGEGLHVEIERQRLLGEDAVVGTTLINMYAKCGSLSKAQEVFDRLPVRDGVAWTALMMGFAHTKQGCDMFRAFHRMLDEGIKPNIVTFLVLLSAGNQTSFSSKAKMYFEAMSEKYGIIPTLEYHTCIINSLVHAGELDKANEVVKRMPFSPDLVLYQALLSASKSTGASDDRMEALQDVMGFYV